MTPDVHHPDWDRWEREQQDGEPAPREHVEDHHEDVEALARSWWARLLGLVIFAGSGAVAGLVLGGLLAVATGSWPAWWGYWSSVWDRLVP